eukprot:5000556-Amphidinium_carterae.1
MEHIFIPGLVHSSVCCFLKTIGADLAVSIGGIAPAFAWYVASQDDRAVHAQLGRAGCPRRCRN